ncbi:MAG: hypothetical protein ACR2KX_17490 [Chitinophagaceae bacterium]
MKQLIFANVAFTFICITSIAQKNQIIKINNSLIAISIEGNSVSSTIATKDGEHGDSKYYPVKTYSNGNTYSRGAGSGFSFGPNVEFYLLKNSRGSFLSFGVHYMQHGAGLFATQGGTNANDPNSIFWKFYPRTTDPEVELKLQSLRVPVSLNQYLKTFGRKKNNSIGVQIGGYLDYLLSAKENDKNVDDAINKIYLSGFAGVKFKFGRLYAHADFSVVHSGNLYTKNYASYYDGSEGNYKETFQTLGVGFYLKK